MLYEKATKLPPFSTPTGVMFLLVWKMRQSIEFQKSRALIQALMSQQGAQDEHIKKVFDDLKESFFPFDKNQRAAELKKMKDAMNYWVNHGPVVVVPQDDGKSQRRMASKLAKGAKDLAQRLTMEKQGSMVELDPFQKAKRRQRGAS
jgi:hypothetical protein